MTDIVEILNSAVAHEASDVILTAGSPPMYRVHGELLPARSPALAPADVKKIVYDALNGHQVAKFEERKELDFSVTIRDKYRFRCNIFLQRGAVGAAMRRIASQIPSLAELLLPPILADFALSPQGFVIVTGPTGHGKTTTQAAMIDLINTRRRCHIVTVEDPVEYLHANRLAVIEQREVGEDTHSFADALKHVLRQNPDVILVGEMRDPESIAAALTAAETGHLVISTLHTNDSIQAIDRIIDAFPPHHQGQIRSQMSLGLLAVVAQRLVPRSDRPGRVAAVEILRNNTAVANLVRDGKTHQLYGVLETSAKDGMRTMDAALKELYLKGTIAFDEARTRMRNPSQLGA